MVSSDLLFRLIGIPGAVVAATFPPSRFRAHAPSLSEFLKDYAAQSKDYSATSAPEPVSDRMPLARVEELPGGGLRLGALVRCNDAANHAVLRERYPLLSQALRAGAAPQQSNLISIGGNMTQRMRVTVHPSDMAVALAALDAVVEVRDAKHTRRIPAAQYHSLPGISFERDALFARGELITAIELPPSAFSAASHYLKISDPTNHTSALVSVAVALDRQGGPVRDARIVLGGIANRPWRAEAAERELVGRRFDESRITAAAQAAVTGAKTLRVNAFKMTLVRRAVAQALRRAGGLA